MAFLGSTQLHSARCGFFGRTNMLNASLTHQRVATPCTGLVVYAGRIGPGKLWEHYELTTNKKAVRVKMHVKTGDTVQVIAGGDKGKVGKITKVNRKTGQVTVEGVNIRTKHVKPQNEEEGGKILKSEFPVHHSNVQHYSEASGIRSRISYRINEEGKKVRVMVKTGEVIDK